MPGERKDFRDPLFSSLTLCVCISLWLQCTESGFLSLHPHQFWPWFALLMIVILTGVRWNIKTVGLSFLWWLGGRIFWFAICISAFQNCPVWVNLLIGRFEVWVISLEVVLCYCGYWSFIWTVMGRLLSHSVACSALCWLLPLLCRNFLISCHPICQILRLSSLWLESFPEGYCLCPHLVGFKKFNCFP